MSNVTRLPTKQPARRTRDPLSVEFARGSIHPALAEVAHQVLNAYIQAFGGLPDFGLNDVQLDEDGNVIESGDISDIIGYATYHPEDHTGPSRLGAELIAGLTGVHLVSADSIISTDPMRLMGPEKKAGAALVCQRLEYRCGHLWGPMLRAVVWRQTMAEIGRDYGGNSQSAAAVGREKVKDGLIFAKEVLDALTREADDARIPGQGPRFALGPIGDQMPLIWQMTENDYRRQVRAPRPDNRNPTSKGVMDKAKAKWPANDNASAKQAQAS